MKYFNITVNGKSYNVAVEELEGNSSAAQPAAAAPVPAPVTETKPTVQQAAAPPKEQAPAVSKAPGSGDPVKAPMPGTILDIKIKDGDMVKQGQPLLVLEAMKMENDIVAPKDGTISSVLVKKGDSVNSNDILLTIA